MGTKIFVVRLKTIIKFVLAAVCIVGAIAILAFMMLKGESKPTYSPGTYSAEIVLHSNPVSVQVTVDKHNILAIEMLNMGETEAVFYPVFEQSFEDIAQQVISLQSTQQVQLTEDNAVTGGIILDAVDTALAAAAKK